MEDTSTYDATAATPELDELYQQDQPDLPLTTVPVQHDGPVTAHLLPARRAQTWTDTVGDTYVPILSGTPKRARAVLIPFTYTMRFSTTPTGDGTLWPVGVPYEIRHTAPIYARTNGAGLTGQVGVTVESWAD